MLARIPDARHSADVDLAVAEPTPEACLDALRRSAEHDLGDFFAFTLGAPTALIQARPGLRLLVTAELGRRPYERFHVDLVTVTPVVTPENTPPLVSVDIPGLVRPDYRVYPLAGVVADKVCAITERHGDHPSTRFRDLVDLTLIAASQSLDASDSRAALEAEFARRGLAPIAELDVPDQRTWSAGYAKTARTTARLHDHVTFEQALHIVKTFLDPLLSGTVITGQWNPDTMTWNVAQT